VARNASPWMCRNEVQNYNCPNIQKFLTVFARVDSGLPTMIFIEENTNLKEKNSSVALDGLD